MVMLDGLRPVFGVGQSYSVTKGPKKPTKQPAYYSNYYHQLMLTDLDPVLLRYHRLGTWDPDKINFRVDVARNLKKRLDQMTPEQLSLAARMALSVDYPSFTPPKQLGDPGRETQLSATERAAWAAPERLSPDTFRKVMSGQLPPPGQKLEQIKLAVVKRQLVALQDIANHALTAEAASVIPLMKGLIGYQRYPDLLEAGLKFVGDEQRHSRVLRQLLTTTLHGQEKTYKSALMGFQGFGYVAMVMPSVASLLALAVETTGGAFFEFMSKRAPDPFVRYTCRLIATYDEVSHMMTAEKIINEHFRPLRTGLTKQQASAVRAHYKDQIDAMVADTKSRLDQAFKNNNTPSFSKVHILNDMSVKVEAVEAEMHRAIYPSKERGWTKTRNGATMNVIANAVYGDMAHPDHYLMKACQVLGINPNELLQYIGQRLFDEFGKVGHPFDRRLVKTIPFRLGRGSTPQVWVNSEF